jgi:uncharacterized membrane protein
MGVLVIGIFRFWRGLNLLAFLSTFIAALWWTIQSYQPRLFWSSQPFFLGYILIFTVLGIHVFGRRVFQRDAYWDGTLLLGTPMLGAILEWRIFSFINHGHALVSVCFAACYLVLALLIWKRRGAAMAFFAEGYLGLAALLANIAIPLELAPQITSAIWAAEGALVFFFGLRLKNVKMVFAALVLHGAAAIAFALDGKADYSQRALFHSSRFTGSLVIALAALAFLVIAQKFRECLAENGEAGAAGGFFSDAGLLLLLIGWIAPLPPSAMPRKEFSWTRFSRRRWGAENAEQRILT